MYPKLNLHLLLQNVVSRLTSLPLVSSTYDIMSKVYLQTKDKNTYLKTVLDVAELGVKTVTLVAMNSALPIIDILDPKRKLKQLDLLLMKLCVESKDSI